MADMSEMPPEPVAADVARALVQLHGCVEDHKRDTKASFVEAGEKLDNLGKVLARVRAAQAGVKRTLSGEKTRTDARLKALEKQVGLIVDATGAKKETPTVAAMSQRRAITVATIIGAFAAWPGLESFFKLAGPPLATLFSHLVAYIGAH